MPGRKLIMRIGIGLAVLYVVLWFLTARSPLMIAARLQEEGKYERANELLSRELEKHPESAQAYSLRGVCRLNLTDFKSGLADLSRAVELAPQEPAVYLQRGYAYLMFDDYATAGRDVQQALALKPGLPSAYAMLAGITSCQGDYRQALIEIGRALDHQPSFMEKPNYYLQRGVLKRLLGDLDGSLADCSEAIRLNPRLPAPYLHRGLAHELRKENTQAQEDFAAYLKRRPRRQAYLARYRQLAAAGRALTVREDTIAAHESEQAATATPAPAAAAAAAPAAAAPAPPPAALATAAPPPAKPWWARPLPRWATLTAAIAMLLGFTGLYSVQTNALELAPEPALPPPLAGELRFWAIKVKWRRMISLVASVGLLVLWYLDRSLTAPAAAIIGAFFISSLMLGNDIRQRITAIQELLRQGASRQ